MAKVFEVLSSSGERSCGRVTLQRAREMVSGGEATWCVDRRAVQLAAAAKRGLSLSPSAKLIERYAEARSSGRDIAAVVAIEGWAPTAYVERTVVGPETTHE